MVGDMETNGQSISEDTSRLLQLIAMFQLAAMQQMGKLPNPITNEIERDLQQAKASIDVLETIKRKTQGNLSELETEFLDKVLFELHMNYVDEVSRPATDTKQEGGGSENGADGSKDETGEAKKKAGKKKNGAGEASDGGAGETEDSK